MYGMTTTLTMATTAIRRLGQTILDAWLFSRHFSRAPSCSKRDLQFTINMEAHFNPMTMSRSYVNAEGRLSRQHPILPTFSKRRILLIAGTFITLIVTNPANGSRFLLPDYLWTRVNYNERLTRSRWFPSKQKSTNYVVVALTKDSARITATGALHTVELCSTASDDPLTRGVCTWIGDTFCHGKPVLDTNDLPYSLTRILSISILVSILISYCAYRPIIWRIPRAPWLEQALSILEQPSWYDILRVNTCVYPALQSMHRMISTMVYERSSVNTHVVFGSMVLIVAIGMIANRLATLLTNHRITGLDASIGACLSYQRTIGTSFILFQYQNAYLSIIHFFWFTAVTYLLDNRKGQFVAFLTGTMLGNGFGFVQRQVLVETFLIRMEVAWRRFVDSLRIL